MKPIIGRTLLTEIPHEGGKITFAHPPFKGYYGNVAKAIDEAGLIRPNSPQTASLIYDAKQNPKGDYESQILNILRNNLLWEFTGNLYLPKKPRAKVHNGIIIESNPKIVRGKLSMDKKGLIKRLESNDPLVEFVPFGFKVNQQSVKDFEKNPYNIARYGEEGANKIAEVASQYPQEPYLGIFNSVNEEIQRMSAVGGVIFGVDGGLRVVGGWDDYYDSLAFGLVREVA